MKFKYNGRIYNPVNVEKKLKKMGITINDIEILPEEKKEDSSIEDYLINKHKFIVRSTLDDIRRICYSDKENPTIEELFSHQMWDEKSKTGLYTKEILKTFEIITKFI